MIFLPEEMLLERGLLASAVSDTIEKSCRPVGLAIGEGGTSGVDVEGGVSRAAVSGRADAWSSPSSLGPKVSASPGSSGALGAMAVPYFRADSPWSSMMPL